MNRQRLLLLVLLAAAVAFTPSAAAADPAPANPARRMTAHALEQLARRSLGGAATPHPAQVRKARLLLRQALDFDPAPAGRWLLLAEAEQLAGRRDGLVDALRGYLERRPKDDVAQLQLIELYAQKQQTAEQLAGFYRRIADGPRARRFTPALRSRVAFKAASVELEQGDPDAYAELLALALKLDPTNKAAAVESFRVLASSPQSAVADQASALLTLFQADPVDPQTHVTIGEALMSFGLYKRAVGWYRSSSGRYRAAGARPPQTALVDWALCLWGSGRLTPALQLLKAAEAGPASQPQDQAPATERGAPAADADPPDRNEPPANEQPAIDPFANATIDSLMPHALMLAASGRADALDRVFPKLIERFDQLQSQSPKATRPIVGEVWARLLCNRGIDAVPRLIGQIEAADESPSESITTLRGWLKLRQGETDAAEQTLAPRADDDPQAALGLCLALERQLDAAKAGGEAEGEAAQSIRRRMIRRLRGVRQRVPAELFGVMAAAKLQRLGLPLEQDEAARIVAETLAQVPAKLREMVTNPHEFLRLTAEVEADGKRIRLGEGCDMEVTLRNVSQFPLSMGPEGSIPTRLMILPSIRVGAEQGPNLRPNVIDLHRRLRLKPGEAVTVRTRVDSGQLGRLLTRNPVPPVRVNLALVLNPMMDRGGGFAPGPMGAVAHVRHILRRPAEGASLDALLGRLRGSDIAAAMRAASVLVWSANAADAAQEGGQAAPAAAGDDADRPEPADRPGRIVEALTEATLGMSPAEQVWLATALPSEPAVADRFDPMIRKLSQADHPAVHMALLATQADNPDSPWINAALRRPAPDPARGFAQAHRAALRATTED